MNWPAGGWGGFAGWPGFPTYPAQWPEWPYYGTPMSFAAASQGAGHWRRYRETPPVRHSSVSYAVPRRAAARTAGRGRAAPRRRQRARARWFAWDPASRSWWHAPPGDHQWRRWAAAARFDGSGRGTGQAANIAFRRPQRRVFIAAGRRGRWVVTSGGRSRPLAVFRSQGDALNYASRFAVRDTSTKVVLLRPDGRIRAEYSYGRRPLSPTTHLAAGQRRPAPRSSAGR
jgi:hypothetical protein